MRCYAAWKRKPRVWRDPERRGKLLSKTYASLSPGFGSVAHAIPTIMEALKQPPHSVDAFVPAWLDDCGLTPTRFRVYCHLRRRAGADGKCYPAAPSIAKTCRISEDTVWPALNDLEHAGLIKRHKGFRNGNYYTFHRLGVTGKQGVTEVGESPESSGRHPLESKGCQSLESRGCKGYPIKGIQQRASKEGREHGDSLSLLPDALEESEYLTLAEKMRVESSVLAKLYPEFVRIKGSYALDWKGQPRSRLPGIFQTFLENDKRGKQLLPSSSPVSDSSSGRTRNSGRTRFAATTKEQHDRGF